MNDYFEEFKKTLLILIITIWASNSSFTVLAFLAKIFGYIKLKLSKRRILPQEQIEKNIEISNLET